jgi:hypothetical protein
MEIFGRSTKEGIVILHAEDGDLVTRIPGAHTIYPVGSNKSCEWEHPEGIVLTQEDTEKLGIEVE